MFFLQRKLVPIAATTLFTALSGLTATAQVVVQRSGIQTTRRIDDNTVIIDKATQKRVSFNDYQRRVQADPDGQHLEPVFDEYGKASAYLIRPTTAEERATHQFRDVDTTQRPRPGDDMPLFIMKDVNGKTYRSTELKGNVVVLSFWVSLKRPFFGEKQIQQLNDVLKLYQNSVPLLSLGVLSDSPDEVRDFSTTRTFPFMPIPDAYGFNRKFQVLSSPSFIVIDKAGKVAAYVDGADYEQLKAVLATVNMP
ncbi:hypothetical protein BN8_04441 [Fibrisoma limi BUZ 3]|uniref:Thioredoxin domain-containing protein n=1 Tax=Fibrisoma limi BUZ 3 TaxID=1185876 RepID=I2GMS2_9BACT|nr:redoxin domain-containing protein [Fibrisoma limi]CCH55200.1 hypothetical protein BN8_04441 [Fibrisoma limi BUZ 3]